MRAIGVWGSGEANIPNGSSEHAPSLAFRARTSCPRWAADTIAKSAALGGQRGRVRDRSALWSTDTQSPALNGVAARYCRRH